MDPTSIAGKDFPLDSVHDHAVIGAGEAGIAAALAAARDGQDVLLVDEHPLDPALIGLDIPWLFGGRVGAAAQNPARMLERIVAARPGLEQAMEAGVTVALGTAVWGAFIKGETSRSLAMPLLGLADGTRAWLAGARRITVATGARDMVLPCAGWTLPGVMGARGLDAALRLYAAFEGRRVAVVGEGPEAEAALATLRAAGVAVAAHLTQPAPLRVQGMTEVEGLAWQDGSGWQEVACDTIVFAIDAVPNLELADLLGCPIAWDAARGGFVPRARAPVAFLGDAAGTAPLRRAPWLAQALADDHALVCACEEVTAGDLRALRPPGYLNAQGPEGGLGRLGEPNQDQVKRLTRAGMGPCQGRRCRDAVHALLSGAAPAPHATHRAPLRPLPLSVLAALEENPAMRANWTGWFGIAAQWLPHWEPAPADAEFIGGMLSADTTGK